MTSSIDHCMQLVCLHAWSPEQSMDLMGDDLTKHLSFHGSRENAPYWIQLLQIHVHTQHPIIPLQTVEMERLLCRMNGWSTPSTQNWMSGIILCQWCWRHQKCWDLGPWFSARSRPPSSTCILRNWSISASDAENSMAVQRGSYAVTVMGTASKESPHLLCVINCWLYFYHTTDNKKIHIKN